MYKERGNKKHLVIATKYLPDFVVLCGRLSDEDLFGIESRCNSDVITFNSSEVTCRCCLKVLKRFEGKSFLELVSYSESLIQGSKKVA
jgi:hypothetical protein